MKISEGVDISYRFSPHVAVAQKMHRNWKVFKEFPIPSHRHAPQEKAHSPELTIENAIALFDSTSAVISPQSRAQYLAS